MMEIEHFLQMNNPRIKRFYQENPQLDFESINLFIVNLIEKCATEQNIEKKNTIESKLISTIRDNSLQILELKSSVINVKDNINIINNKTINNFLLKYYSIKSEYIDELTIIINSNNIDRRCVLENNNKILINKTSAILDGIVPKSQYHEYNLIKETIEFYKKTIVEDTHILSNNIDNNSIKVFLEKFEIKSNIMLQNIQKHIYSYISLCEEKIQKNIMILKEMFKEKKISVPDISNDIMDISTSKTENIQKQPTQIPIHILLNRLYTTSEVIRIPKKDSTPQSGMSNLYMMKRENLPKILIKNISMEHNIEEDKVFTFIENVEYNHCHGIFLSQYSGITSKSNYHIECYNGYIYVFVHNVEYNPEKIRIAVDIIDNLSLKLKNYGIENDEYMIDKDILEEINKEYQVFIGQKESIITILREGQRKIISQIEDFRFPYLDKYLSTKFLVPLHKQGFKCDLCKLFNGNNLKALAAHKRGCTRKLCNTIPTNTIIRN